MRFDSFNCMIDKKAQKRLIASMLLICFIAIFLLSEIFILTRSRHWVACNCPTGSCATCDQISTTDGLLQLLSFAIAAFGFALGCLSFIYHIVKPVLNKICFSLLVKLKVRMNN